MDNSPAWDDPLDAVPEVDWSYQRRDLGHVDSEQRPHKPQYDRYLYLVDFYKNNGFDSQYIYDNCPYKVIDVGIVATLQRAGRDLIELCQTHDYSEGVDELRAELERTADAINMLWSDERRCFLSRDLLTGEPLDEITTATVLPLLGGLADSEQATAIAELIGEWLSATAFGLSSTHPSSARYESQRYWRGPVWLHINWLLSVGLLDYGYTELADRLRSASLDCVRAAGFWEYFDADTGAGCGGDEFSWTAATALYWLTDGD